MEWYVYRHKINSDRIEKYNIFNHGSFNKEIKELLADASLSATEFKEKVYRCLQYYFWCKAEWEIVLGPWVGSRSNPQIKVDVFTQVWNNADRFIEYLNSQKEV